MKIEFTKMQGAGNDYIYVNTLIYPLPNPEELAVAWSRPHTGIGSDGLVLIGSSGKADFSMRIFNADGSEAKMCGNASRCIGKYVYEYGLTRKTEVTLDTLSGIKTLRLHVEDGKVDAVTVDMGIPADIHPVDLGEGYPYREGIAVSMGNPHLVIFVDDMEQVDLPRVGPVTWSSRRYWLPAVSACVYGNAVRASRWHAAPERAPPPWHRHTPTVAPENRTSSWTGARSASAGQAKAPASS